MKRKIAGSWWWRIGRSAVMRCCMLGLAVAALIPGRAAGATRPDDEDIKDRIGKIRKQVKKAQREQFKILKKLGTNESEARLAWHNHWHNHWHRWHRWHNWNKLWLRHWHNHWHNHWPS